MCMGWVKLGGEFDGYMLESYDVEVKVLFLKKDGKMYMVVLVDSKFDGSVKVVGFKVILVDVEVVFVLMQLEDMLSKMIEK